MKKNGCIFFMLAVLLALTGSGVMGCGGNVINNGSGSRTGDSVVSGASVWKGKIFQSEEISVLIPIYISMF